MAAADSSTVATSPESAAPSALVARINQLLRDHPAAEKLCGTKQSHLTVQGASLVLESSWSRCPGTDRSTARLDALDPGSIETETTPRYGQARLYVGCRGDAACSPRFTRRAPDGDWDHVRVEPAFTIDCAPREEAVRALAAAMTELLRATTP